MNFDYFIQSDTILYDSDTILVYKFLDVIPLPDSTAYPETAYTDIEIVKHWNTDTAMLVAACILFFGLMAIIVYIIIQAYRLK